VFSSCADKASWRALRSWSVRSSPSSSATRSMTVPSGNVVGSSSTSRPFSTRARSGLIRQLYGFLMRPASVTMRVCRQGERRWPSRRRCAGAVRRRRQCPKAALRAGSETRHPRWGADARAEQRESQAERIDVAEQCATAGGSRGSRRARPRQDPSPLAPALAGACGGLDTASARRPDSHCRRQVCVRITKRTL
jgi:hypothetical protein